MTKAILIFFVLAAEVNEVVSDYCYSQTYPLGTPCEWGCCYGYIYPCCDAPLYATPAFIISMSVVGASVLIVIISAIIFVRRRRRRRAAMMQYGTVIAAPEIMPGPPGTNTYGGYYNPQYPTPVVNAVQPPSETTPLYSSHPPIGHATIYGGPPSKA